MCPNKSIIGFRIDVFIESDETGFYAYCPALKGLHTCGDTEEEALQNAKDAATAYLQSSIKHGDPIPVGIIMMEETKEASRLPKVYASRHTEDLEIVCAI